MKVMTINVLMTQYYINVTVLFIHLYKNNTIQ